MLDADLPDEEWDTVGGFLFGTLEHVPEQGESVETDGWRFAAEELDGRRIRLVRVTPLPPARPERALAADAVPLDRGRADRSTTFAADGDLTRRQGRARHRRVEGHRQGHRRRARRRRAPR